MTIDNLNINEDQLQRDYYDYVTGVAKVVPEYDYNDEALRSCYDTGSFACMASHVG